jgi:dolichyl-phosphate beta-glucosyltransferase
MKLSIVIPAYNEEKRIMPTLSSLTVYLEKEQMPYEIIVVDDGSKDKTAELIEKAAKIDSRVKLLKNPGNKGKGYSVRNGMLKAEGDFVLMYDADGATPPEEISKLFLRGESPSWDVAIGSRRISGANIIKKQGFFREINGKMFSLFTRAMLPEIRAIVDTQCGFKAFRKNAAREIFGRAKIDGFSFDIEALLLAKKMGFVVKEIPVNWINDDDSRVSVAKNLKAVLAELWRIRLGTKY